MVPVKATINIVIDEAFKGTSINDIECLVEKSYVVKDELTNLENTATSLAEKIKQTKVISDVEIADNTKSFEVHCPFHVLYRRGFTIENHSQFSLY